jgi:hypothetical protein
MVCGDVGKEGFKMFSGGGLMSWLVSASRVTARLMLLFSDEDWEAVLGVFAVY